MPVNPRQSVYTLQCDVTVSVHIAMLCKQLHTNPYQFIIVYIPISSHKAEGIVSCSQPLPLDKGIGWLHETILNSF